MGKASRQRRVKQIWQKLEPDISPQLKDLIQEKAETLMRGGDIYQEYVDRLISSFDELGIESKKQLRNLVMEKIRDFQTPLASEFTRNKRHTVDTYVDMESMSNTEKLRYFGRIINGM